MSFLDVKPTDEERVMRNLLSRQQNPDDNGLYVSFNPSSLQDANIDFLDKGQFVHHLHVLKLKNFISFGKVDFYDPLDKTIRISLEPKIFDYFEDKQKAHNIWWAEQRQFWLPLLVSIIAIVVSVFFD